MMFARLTQTLKQLGREGLKLLLTTHTHQQQRKFVATQSRDHVPGADYAPQPIGKGQQDRVAGVMTKSVIGQLELVDVEEDKRKPAFRAVAASEFVHPALKKCAVGESG